MSVETRYRVTYSAYVGSWGGRVKLSEIILAEDLERAYAIAKDWAERQKWILLSVEELG